MILILLLVCGILALVFFFFALGTVVRPRPLSTQSWMRVTQFLSFIASIYLTLWIVLVTVHLVVPQKTGVLALTQVLAPLLLIPAIIFVPLVFARNNKAFRWFASFIIAVFLVYCPPSIAFPDSLSSNNVQQIRVMNWNVTISPERNQIVRLRPLLQADLADVIVLQEAHWGWLRADPMVRALYPHQLVHTEQASSGLVVLSRYPVLEHGTGSQLPNAEGWPRLVWAKLDLGRGIPLWIVAAHPESPYTSNRSDCRFPQ